MAADKASILKRANKLFRQGKIDAAIKEYKKILDIKPNDLEIRRIIGDLERKQNNIASASEQYQWIADYYMKEGFFTKAIAMFKMITRIDPNSDKAQFQLAELYSKQGLVIEAKQIYLDIAEEYKRKNNQKKALDMYKKILEFDKSNIKMRLLLADNYLKEGLKDDAVDEYVTAANILIAKKEYQKVEEFLNSILGKVKDPKILERLVYCYTQQGDEDKAINFLIKTGDDAFKNVELLKILGELYFKKNEMGEAENVFKRIVEIDPEETEVIMKLGKVYLQRNEYDRAFQLFLPIVDKNIGEQKFEEASSFLRFIIASNNAYFPALNKLASIFKASDKTSNLIALYESLIPIYEQEAMTEELKQLLEELIEISDSPFNYEERLAKLKGEPLKKPEPKPDDKEDENVDEFLHGAEDAIQEGNFDKAITILKQGKSQYHRNMDVRSKMFDVYQMANEVELAIEEGKELLELYKSNGREDEYKNLLNILTNLNPGDEKLVELSHDEATQIELSFGKEELDEQFGDIDQSSTGEIKFEEQTDDVLVLSEDENLAEPQYKTEEISKSLTSYLSEIDFYINDGYFGDAEKLIEDLRHKYPESKELISRFEKIKQVRQEEPEKMVEEPDLSNGRGDFIKESSNFFESQKEEFEIDLSSFSEGFEEELGAEPENIIEQPVLQDQESSGELLELNEEISPNEESASSGDLIELNEELSAVEEKETSGELIEVGDDVTLLEDSGDASADLIDLKGDAFDEIQSLEEQKGTTDESEMELDLPREEPIEELPVVELEKIKSVSSPKQPISRAESADDIDLDQIMGSSDSGPDIKSPFKEVDSDDIPFDDEEELLQDEVLFLDDDIYMEIENGVEEELEAINDWLKELERQRTSTTEKNMMEIFDEFKRGVEEKIGVEDFDTRYNLGIAYKEMGLVEEAIHEFLISSKHPEKFFDSAGLLGMCFRDKGMFEEAISWFEKAMESKGRKPEEYLAIQYEMVTTHRKREDYISGLKVVEDIMRVNSSYRDIEGLYDEFKELVKETGS